jgi:hypothetical protein
MFLEMTLQNFTKAIISGGFIQFFIHLYFGNYAEEFYPHETFSTPMKLLSLFINTVPHQHI